MDIESIFATGFTFSRAKLEEFSGSTDRMVRRKIRELRRAGVPIMAVREGGYKLAQTSEEKKLLLNMYRSRAMDELKTYSVLKKSFQVEGQTSLDALIRELEVAQ